MLILQNRELSATLVSVQDGGGEKMTRTIVLFGRMTEAMPSEEDGSMTVPWKEAFNFQENAGYMISAAFENAVVVPVNSTHGTGETAAVRLGIDRTKMNFRGFTVHMWLGDRPYHPAHINEQLESIDFDWIAFIPCSAMLT